MAAWWVWWVLATTAGWLAGSIAVLLVLSWSTGAADALLQTAAGSAVLGGLMGLAISLCQRLVLRQRLHGLDRWLVVGVGAWAVAWALGQAITNTSLNDYWSLAFVPAGVLSALIVSFGHWLVLKRVVG